MAWENGKGWVKMALTREAIVETAMGILRDYGLADLSMRRLARDLGVQPGALYWHVKNKQELLTVLAGLILTPVAIQAPDSLRELAVRVRETLLTVRDSAEVVALAHALDPRSTTPLQLFGVLLEGEKRPADQAEWAAEALVSYVLGSVTDEQTRAGLTSAGLLATTERDAGKIFTFGLDLMLSGLATQPTQHAS